MMTHDWQVPYTIVHGQRNVKLGFFILLDKSNPFEVLLSFLNTKIITK